MVLYYQRFVVVADLLVLPMCTSAVRTGYRREDKEYVQATEEEASAEHKVEITHLSLTQSAMIVIVAMKKEKGGYPS